MGALSQTLWYLQSKFCQCFCEFTFALHRALAVRLRSFPSCLNHQGCHDTWVVGPTCWRKGVTKELHPSLPYLQATVRPLDTTALNTPRIDRYHCTKYPWVYRRTLYQQTIILWIDTTMYTTTLQPLRMISHLPSASSSALWTMFESSWYAQWLWW